MGCANQAGEDNRNVARMSLLLAGLPTTVAGQTVNRLCGSGLQAINTAAHAIQAGEGEVWLAGGVESMTRAPFVLGKAESAFARGEMKLQDSTLGWRFVNPKLAEMHHPYSMGETAENVAEKHRRLARRPGRLRGWRAIAAPSPRSTRDASATRLCRSRFRRAGARPS